MYIIDKSRGTSGPTSIEQARYAPGASNFIKAGQEQGFEVKDANGFQSIGNANLSLWYDLCINLYI